MEIKIDYIKNKKEDENYIIINLDDNGTIECFM